MVPTTAEQVNNKILITVKTEANKEWYLSVVQALVKAQKNLKAQQTQSSVIRVLTYFTIQAV
jgi:hypothetical protein